MTRALLARSCRLTLVLTALSFGLGCASVGTKTTECVTTSLGAPVDAFDSDPDEWLFDVPFALISFATAPLCVVAGPIDAISEEIGPGDAAAVARAMSEAGLSTSPYAVSDATARAMRDTLPDAERDELVEARQRPSHQPTAVSSGPRSSGADARDRGRSPTSAFQSRPTSGDATATTIAAADSCPNISRSVQGTARWAKGQGSCPGELGLWLENRARSRASCKVWLEKKTGEWEVNMIGVDPGERVGGQSGGLWTCNGSGRWRTFCVAQADPDKDWLCRYPAD